MRISMLSGRVTGTLFSFPKARERNRSRFTLIVAFAATLMAPFGWIGSAQAACSVPNNITNGQVTDATQLMGNFNAITGCAPSISGAPTIGNLTKFAAPSTITSGDLSGDVTTSGSLATTLAPTGVSAGSYTCASITVDAKGRALAAASGSCGSGASPPTLVQSAGERGTTNSQTSFSVTLPSTPTPGDLLLAVMAGFSGGTNLACPTGFAGAFSSQSQISNQGVLVCARTVQSGDGTAYSATLGGFANGGTTFAVLEFSNAFGFQASATGGTPSGIAWPMFAVPLNAACFVLAVVESDQTNSYSSITGGTLIFDGTNSSGGSVNHPAVLFRASGFGQSTVNYTGSGYGNSIVAMVNVIG